ncbi:MAG: nitroreductase family protein [Acidimicrobiales bacterium]
MADEVSPAPALAELYDALMTTRAMRRFSDDPVSAEVVEAILAAAVQAPSGGNIQPYQFLVVTDPDKRAALGEIYLRSWLRYEPAVAKITPPAKTPEAARAQARNLAATDHLARSLAAVPVLVLVLVPRISMAVTDDEGTMDVGPVHASVYPAVQNLALAARAYGLGTVLTTVYRVYEDEVRAVCAVPDRYEVAALLPLGRPTGRWGVARRRPAPSITSWNTFGARR